MSSHLTPEQRNERAALALRTAQEITNHTETKAAWIKGWKLKLEVLQARHDQLEEEAGTGLSLGRQLSIPEADAAPSTTVDVLSGRWAELVKISPPRIAAWTLKEADLSPVAKKLLERLKPKETLGKPASVTLELGDLPEQLGCTAVESLDAVAELLCFELATLRGGKNLSASGAREGLLRLDSWRDDGEEGPGLTVLHEMIRTELDDVHPDCLLLGTKLPRRALLPLMEGLKGLGAVTSTEKGWRRVARVPVWEKLVLDALARAKGVSYQAERALTGCLDFDWTVGGLVEAGVIRRGAKSEVTGQAWELVPEADRQPLSLDDVKTLVKRRAPKEGSKEAAPLQQLASALELQPPTVRRACEALVAEGWLVEAATPKHSIYFGPWYARKVDKAAEGKAKQEKGKKKAAKPVPNLRRRQPRPSPPAVEAAPAESPEPAAPEASEEGALH